MQNEDVLSGLLGIGITLERREEAVGRFSLDLIGRNNDDGSTVIVENRLESTDHNHLGQLLNYALGPGYQMPFAQGISQQASTMKVGNAGVITEAARAQDALES